jgi:hypothetical protein
MSVLYHQREDCATSVPDIVDLSFDLDSMDCCFEDIDIKLEDLDPEDEAYASAFNEEAGSSSSGDLALFEFDRLRDISLNLEAVAAATPRGKRAAAHMLEDMDGGREDQLIRQDCMWSSVHSQSAAKFFKTEAGGQQEAGRRYTAPFSSSASLLGLTPPTSYMHKHLLLRNLFDTPAAGEEDASSASSSGDDEMMEDAVGGVHWWSNSLTDAVSRLCSVPVAEPVVTSRDHSYFSCAGAKKSSSYPASSALTPPESSEDEDSFQGFYVSAASEPASKSLRTADQTCLDTSSFSRSVSRGRSSALLPRGTKPKFTFRINIKSTAATKKLTRLARPSRRHHRAGVKSEAVGAAASAPRLQGFSVTYGSEDENRLGLRGQEPKGPRDIHNHNERQRRTDLKNAFDYLKLRVPAISGSDRVSKQMILDKAIEFCRGLKAKEASTRQHQRLLAERNELLRKKLQSLKVRKM